MKALVSFISSLLLTAFLLAPSILVVENDQNIFGIELNEDEKNKEEKKELSEDDFFIDNYFKKINLSQNNSLNPTLARIIFLDKRFWWRKKNFKGIVVALV